MIDRRKSARPRRAPFTPSREKRYLAFNKPFGVLSQFTPEPGSSAETLAAFGFPRDVYTIGRLDHDSEGLILLSDDGALNNALLDPDRSHERTYIAQVERIPTEIELDRLREGVDLQGRRTLPARVALLHEEPLIPPRPVPIRYRPSVPTAWIALTLVEGKNRQVRRMTAAIGHPTLRLVRVAIGGLDLHHLGLLPGEWRGISSEEIALALQPGSA